MLLLRTERLPEGPNWLHELKLDGYRAIGIKFGRSSVSPEAQGRASEIRHGTGN
jgi:hypothetical protein